MAEASMHVHQAIPRVDPRRPYLITPSGLKRVVLGATEGSRERMQAGPLASARPWRSQGPFDRYLLVVCHAERAGLDEAAREALAAAAILADAHTEVRLVLFGGDAASAAVAAAAGADRILLCDDPGFAPARKLAWLRQLWSQDAPLQVLLPDRGADADLGRRLAAGLQLGVACAVVEIDPGRQVRSQGGGGRQVWQVPPPVLLLARKVADTRLPFTGQGHCEYHDLPLIAAGEPVRDRGVSSSPAALLALDEADLVVSAGNGVLDTAGLCLLADQLGAAVGASRVAVDDGRFCREQQVGATGKTVQASAYLAFGISGAVQHLQGIRECRHVIAVNLDPAAPIVKRANLTLIEDCQALIAALRQLLPPPAANLEPEQTR
jgi:electron transfer flavoprotein alpha subunit